MTAVAEDLTWVECVTPKNPETVYEFGDRFRQEVSELWSRLSGGTKSRVTTMFVVSTSSFDP